MKNLVDQVRKSLSPSGAPTAKKLEEKNTIEIGAKKIATAAPDKVETQVIGSYPEIAVIPPYDADPHEASLLSMPKWMTEPGAVFGAGPGKDESGGDA
jgi:hypothetical protein